MERDAHAASLFSHSLDRAVFVVYFLGAVVPLLALGYFVQGYVVPGLVEGYDAAAVIGSVVWIGVLSLASFGVLRRLVLNALARTNADNRRLGELLGLSRSLALASHAAEVVDTTARCALDMGEATAALVLGRAKEDEPFSVRSAAGHEARATWDELEPALRDAVELASGEGRPLLVGTGLGFSAAAIPLQSGHGAVCTLVALRTRGERGFGPAEVDALSTLAGIAGVALRNAELHDAQRNFFTHVTDVLVTALDAHLDQQYGHTQRVAQYANHIGRVLGLDDRRLERLHFAALLHDIGMLKLDRAHHRSRKAAEKHPQLGYRMLHRIRLWEDIAPFVQHHHEWFDGSGYPEGLCGEDIPLESRIIAVADAFDAITSDASYKPARPVDEAVRELRAGAGTQFDPQLVDVLVQLVADGAVEPLARS